MLRGILRGWSLILRGYNPVLSIELTRECPLHCPGCYAYGDQHLGGALNLRQLNDYKGQELVDRFFELVRAERPVHISIIGGEPLVRFRELNEILPRLSQMGIHVQLVTSAVRPIPLEWRSIANLSIVVSVDGLQPEHDLRRAPATYERIAKNTEGHSVTIHWTITGQQVKRDGYMEDFVKLWTETDTTRRIWVSLYTPQVGESSDEILSGDEREVVVSELLKLRKLYSKLHMHERVIHVYRHPPASPAECIFSNVTTCVSSDFERKITPCQFGGTPDCKNCGCMASAGLKAIGRYQLPIGIPVEPIFTTSFKIGSWFRNHRQRKSPQRSEVLASLP